MSIWGMLIALVEIGLSLDLAYLYLLLLAGKLPARRAASPEAGRCLRFAVAIPAHDEASVIGRTVSSLRHLDYPVHQFDVHVVADYCEDDTARIALDAGAIVHERHAGPRGRKSFALEWLLAALVQDPRRYEAIVVMDADSQVAPGCLRIFNEKLLAGAQVVQGRHVIVNPGASVFAALADVDMRLNNRIRNQAKENLGLSARLMGDAMCFRREILEAHPWNGALSFSEDREYGLQLVLGGVRIHFASEAVSQGQAARRWRDATGQRLRWYGGTFALSKRYLRSLLTSAWRQRNLAAADLALELSLPAYSTLVAASTALAATLMLAGLVRTPWFAANGALLLLVWLYPLLGMLAERAPWRSLGALLLGPAYAAWRVWLGLRVRLQPDNVRWIRTPRSEEAGQSKT